VSTAGTVQYVDHAGERAFVSTDGNATRVRIVVDHLFASMVEFATRAKIVVGKGGAKLFGACYSTGGGWS
jgi:hypothetical protein